MQISFLATENDLRELHSHEGGRERLRQDDLVAGHEVIRLPFGDICVAGKVVASVNGYSAGDVWD